MAGLTNNGLETKRLIDVINELKTQAGPIFQDLVPPGDIVDTGDSSTIGRLIGLVSPGYSDLWEALNQLYWAFDPNSATGIPHDNLVMYGGLTRGQPSPTTAIVLVWGNETTQIPSTAQVRSTDNNFYTVSTPVLLDRNFCNGFEVSISAAVNGQIYGFEVTSGASTASISYTAGPSDTIASISQALITATGAYPWLTASSTDNGNIRVVATDYLDYISFSVLGTRTIVQKIRARIEVANTVNGEIEQDANTITTIATPILGWDSVNNPDPGTTGRNTETDEELRIRFRDSKFIRAQNISDALYSALRAIDGVLSAGVFENESDSYNATYDLPPHSFRAVVQGGSPTDIAQAIWKNKPLGIKAEGNTFSTITDSQGFPRDIYFDRPIPVNVYISMTLEVDTNTFPANGVDQIKANLIEYFQDNFSIGDEVIYSRLYTPINMVPGHQVNILRIGTSPSPTGTSNIVVPYNGIATISSSNIVITVV